MNFRDIEYKGCELKESRIIDLFYFKFMDIPLLSRMEAVAEYFIDEVETLRDRDLSEEEREEITERFLKMYETRDCYVLYSRFLTSEGLDPLPHVTPEKRRLKYEDVYPVLYLKNSLYRSRSNHGIKHLVVDEMQDYSWVQYLLLKKLFPCRMTILGDRAQTMEEQQQDVLGFLPKIFGKDIRRIIMNRSYRNTVEVAEYANHLAGICDMELFERHGKPVQEKNFSTKTEALDEVLKIWKESEDRFETAALVFLTEEEARWAASYITEKLEDCGSDAGKISYLDRNSQTFAKGLTVTTFYLAKGLEFDQVFGVFEGGRAPSIQNQAQYITATRALHELYMFEHK